ELEQLAGQDTQALDLLRGQPFGAGGRGGFQRAQQIADTSHGVPPLPAPLGERRTAATRRHRRITKLAQNKPFSTGEVAKFAVGLAPTAHTVASGTGGPRTVLKRGGKD